MTYDADLRRDTPLAQRLAKAIAASGPVRVSDYMRLCLADPEHGYYTSRIAVGAGGDFITAPEVSQVFGELIGLWAAVVWEQMGRPAPLHLIELGPGRGTLMRDELRAARKVPAFVEAMAVSLVELPGPLQRTQRETLASAHPRIAWHDRLDQVPGGAAIVIANEFIDTLPIGQWVACEEGWRRRMVGLDAKGRLTFVLGDVDANVPDTAPAGTVRERRCGLDEIARLLAKRAQGAPVVALLIDYGHADPYFGDTLQAVRNHGYEHPLTSPGEADLTAQVDFADLAARFRDIGLAVDGPITQTEFLGRLGAAERASRLMSSEPGRAGEIETGVARLMAPAGMGTRFKAIAARSPILPAPPGFE